MLPEDFHDRYILQKKYKNFSIFNPQNYDFIEKNIRPRFYSPLGELVKDFSDNSIIFKSF